jgi:metal-dependent hydrolase (beta-lactamase superfamily II)
MSVVMITLAENTVAMPRFLADWGLSILLKANDCIILFDT